MKLTLDEFKKKVDNYDIDEDIKVTLLEDLEDSFSNNESEDVSYKDKYLEMRERYKKRFLESEEIEDTELIDGDNSNDDDILVVDVKEI